MDANLNDVVNERLQTGLNWFNEMYPFNYIVEAPKECCHSRCTQIQVTNKNRRVINTIIITRTAILHHYHIRNYHCSHCGSTYPFDGRGVGLINYQNRFVVAVEAFQELLEYKVNSGLPTHSWWKTKVYRNELIRIGRSNDTN
jgi:hypothetical protein